MLALDGVSVSFGEARALSALTLRVAEGEVYALLGPNGAGKTTALNLILGFVAPDAGTILVDGVDAVADPLEARARIAYLPETVMLHPALSAVENLRYFALLAGHKLTPDAARGLLGDRACDGCRVGAARRAVFRAGRGRGQRPERPDPRCVGAGHRGADGDP